VERGLGFRAVSGSDDAQGNRGRVGLRPEEGDSLIGGVRLSVRTVDDGVPFRRGVDWATGCFLAWAGSVPRGLSSFFVLFLSPFSVFLFVS
jgi:hypothetical protein